jgi:hypothetical protein
MAWYLREQQQIASGGPEKNEQLAIYDPAYTFWKSPSITMISGARSVASQR